MSQLTAPQVGTAHEYLPGLMAFEFGGVNGDSTAPNVVLFIGGLGDGLLTVPYVPQLANAVRSVNSADGGWVVVQALISSSYQGWGVGSLQRDAKELSLLVKYLRSNNGGARKKIVLMGHLTGCQDTMQYLAKLSHQGDVDQDILLDGAVLQAPVSDREAVVNDAGGMKNLEPLLQKCRDEYISVGKKDHILPQEYRQLLFGTPITAYRFNALVSVRGDDDFYSSDLTADDHRTTFGKIDKPVLVLFGEKDEFVPNFVDREQLVKLWQNATSPQFWSPLSKVLQGASHNVGPTSDKGAVEDLVQTVVRFIESI